ncbi:efflux RND transporter periplasmic adaptor subunit [Brevundimonas sp. PWP3-1b1]|uniref:efflux RND transporter periplasmic adaptor subunit n=1 Tax=unclassified Brevundimonas TaxID=2622653 RepID=UPI003CE6FD20
MIKRHFFLIAAAVLLGLMVIAAIVKITTGDGKSAQGPGAAGGRRGGQEVSQAVVGQRQFSDQIRVLGVARGQRSVNITSSTTELITRVLFADGQLVSAGTPLVELQAREEDAAIIEARATVNQAQREYDRYKALADRGIAPQVMLEQAETGLETARASLQAAQARRGDRVIRAPFAGRMGLTTVTAGTLINPGAVIATLDDTSTIRVDFPLPERYLNLLQPGAQLTATADAYGDEPFQGRIALIDTRVNEATRAATARAEFANPGGRIRPGMLLRVVVQQGQRQAAAAPESAVQYEGAGAFVYRIAPGQNGSTAQRVEVEAGAVENGFVEILSGIEPGDRIVGSGLNRIQPGAPVSVAGADRKSSADRKSGASQ